PVRSSLAFRLFGGRGTEIMSEIASLEERALKELQACGNEETLRAWNSAYLGKQGAVQQALKKIGEKPPAERPAYGQEANRVKQALEAAHTQAVARLKEQELQRSLTEDRVDVTLPGRPTPRGRLHVATKVMREIQGIFADLGFQVYRSREVEDDETNFELL